MTTATNHTPTPWRIGDAGRTVFGPPNGNPSPETVAHTSRANAAHIVRCVNGHDALVAALRDLTRYVDAYEYGRKWAGRPHAEMDAARAALAAAKGAA